MLAAKRPLPAQPTAIGSAHQSTAPASPTCLTNGADERGPAAKDLPAPIPFKAPSKSGKICRACCLAVRPASRSTLHLKPWLLARGRGQPEESGRLLMAKFLAWRWLSPLSRSRHGLGMKIDTTIRGPWSLTTGPPPTARLGSLRLSGGHSPSRSSRQSGNSSAPAPCAVTAAVRPPKPRRRPIRMPSTACLQTSTPTSWPHDLRLALALSLTLTGNGLLSNNRSGRLVDRSTVELRPAWWSCTGEACEKPRNTEVVASLCALRANPTSFHLDSLPRLERPSLRHYVLN